MPASTPMRRRKAAAHTAATMAARYGCTPAATAQSTIGDHQRGRRPGTCSVIAATSSQCAHSAGWRRRPPTSGDTTNSAPPTATANQPSRGASLWVSRAPNQPFKAKHDASQRPAYWNVSGKTGDRSFSGSATHGMPSTNPTVVPTGQSRFGIAPSGHACQSARRKSSQPTQ